MKRKNQKTIRTEEFGKPVKKLKKDKSKKLKNKLKTYKNITPDLDDLELYD